MAAELIYGAATILATSIIAIIRELAGVLPRRRHFPLFDGGMGLIPAACPTGRQA